MRRNSRSFPGLAIFGGRRAKSIFDSRNFLFLNSSCYLQHVCKKHADFHEKEKLSSDNSKKSLKSSENLFLMFVDTQKTIATHRGGESTEKSRKCNENSFQRREQKQFSGNWNEEKFFARIIKLFTIKIHDSFAFIRCFFLVT